ncbi:MAG: tripartite tricarboxylate transporter TctB family protein [Qingshengfaniella sp.]
MTKDRMLGLALIGLGAIGIAGAWRIQAMTFNNDPGPRLFPIFACSILILSGLTMLPGRRRPAAPPQDTAAPRTGTGNSPEAQARRGRAISAVLILYGIGLWLLGYTTATLAMVFALYWLIAGPERRQLGVGILFSLIATGAMWVLFAKGLNAFLPRGILF